jgi:hypothetical protein
MGIEYFGPDQIRERFGVSKLPMPLPPTRTQENYPPEYIGSGRSERVLVTIDLDDAGGVEHVEAIVPPPRPPNVKIRAILIDAKGEQREMHEAGRSLDPLFARAAETSVRQMRFSPAELNGERVAFRGLRMTLILSDPQSRRA